MLPLVNAERSWSRAMELKAELEKEAVSYKRQHMVRPLLRKCFLQHNAGYSSLPSRIHALPLRCVTLVALRACRHDSYAWRSTGD